MLDGRVARILGPQYTNLPVLGQIDLKRLFLECIEQLHLSRGHLILAGRLPLEASEQIQMS